MIDFIKNGKRYIACRGYMAVFNAATDDKELSVQDVFQETDPTPEMCLSLYSDIKEIMKKQDEKPKQTKARTKDPF